MRGIISKIISISRNGIREDSQLDLFLREFRQNRLALLGLLLVSLYVIVGLLAPYIIPQDPAAIDTVNQYNPPSVEHPFGTDQLGRDIFSRVISGTRISIRVAFLSIGFASVAGVAFGLTAGYFGGQVDEAIMRFMDVLFAFPSIILALVIIAILGGGLNKAIVALAIVYTPSMARITRGSTLSIREEEYVLAAKSYGESTFGIMIRDILPNITAPIVVQATVSFGFAILAEAALSFLGLGASPPTPSWGVMISQGQSVIETAPWASVFPGIAIMSAVLGLNLLGDGLRDALDPTSNNGGDS